MSKSPRNLTKTKTTNQDCLNSKNIQSSTTKKTRKKSTKHEENINRSTKKDTNSNQNSSSINNDIDNDTFLSPTRKAKRNAFELLMDSRHKVIGRNSPGKERESDNDDDYDDVDKTDKKSEKISRRLFLENWADSKGASKRKRIDEEIEQCINEKMEKRSKRLKEMLKINQELEEDENDETNTELTNKNLKSWRMKIKLCLEENQKKIENDTNKNCRIVGGRVLRDKKLKPNYYNEDDEDNKNTISKRINCVTIVLDDDSTKQTTKIAPVFQRSIPKPKIDPAIIEAKREFLLSGIPTSFRKELIKQPSFEDVKYDVFPTVSHIQQKDDHSFWNLDNVNLKLLPIEEVKEMINVENSTFQLVLNKINGNNDNNYYKNMNFEKIKCYRTIVEKIKLQYPDYPIYRMFKTLYEQSGYKERIIKNEKTFIKKRGRKKNNDKNIEINDFNDCLLWTEKYKPKDSKQILGNYHTVTSLKNWLSSFKQNKKLSNNSESEFDTDDDSSRDSYNTTRNTIILTGPCGCGKTSAIYAICNELDYNIIEINTSMKRTGKRLIHDLQEATQSHQLRRQQQQQNNLTKFLNCKQQKEKEQKFCVLLIEDIDIIFEQEDESFYSALNQISSITKRPIILTTNNYNSLIEQKFLLQFQVFRFLSPITSTTTLTINLWLQLICLIEGIYIDLISIKQLFIRNDGDIRRTLLELQFWVNTGGQIKQQQKQFHQQINNDIANSCNNINNKDDDDNDSNLSTIIPNEDQLNNHKIHNNCIDCFETINNNLYELTNLERVWWNLPNLLQLPDCKSTRLRNLLINNNNNNDKEIIDNNDNSREFIQNLMKFSKIYDNLLLTDFYYKSYTTNSNLDQLWHVEIKDSLSINENFENFTNPSIGYDLSHYLIFNNLKYYGFQTEQFNSAVPEPIEIKWRNKMRSCDKNFRNAIPLMTEQNSIKLDYMPILRNIARFELQRSVTNTKRNHRFYNYLRNLGINCNDKTYKLACDIFKI